MTTVLVVGATGSIGRLVVSGALDAGFETRALARGLVRSSGLPYTIVSPGWFDYNGPNAHRLVMLQGDTRWASDPSDGVVSRAQLANVLVAPLTSDAAKRKTLELVRVRYVREQNADARPRIADALPDVSGCAQVGDGLAVQGEEVTDNAGSVDQWLRAAGLT